MMSTEPKHCRFAVSWYELTATRPTNPLYRRQDRASSYEWVCTQPIPVADCGRATSRVGGGDTGAYRGVRKGLMPREGHGLGQTGRYSPLRYPGGKGKLSKFMAAIVRANGLSDGRYIEPYAGGAGVAWELLVTGVARLRQLGEDSVDFHFFPRPKSLNCRSPARGIDPEAVCSADLPY